MPIGLLGKKLGMTQVFHEDGTARVVTVMEAGPCMVTQVKTIAKDGYEAVQLSFGEKRKLNRPEEGHLKQLGKFRYLREFPPADLDSVQVGQRVDVSIFEPGDLIRVTGTTKGRGFAGGIKRHGFKGGPKTHGQSDRHRAPGSIGAGTTPGRVLKGKRMAGHMGVNTVTQEGLEVVQVDVERNLLLVKGSIPGAPSQLVLVEHTEKGIERLKRDPVWSRPVAEEPVAEEVAEESVAEEVAEEPVAEEVAEEPVAEEVAEEPVAEEVVEESVAEEPLDSEDVANDENEKKS